MKWPPPPKIDKIADIKKKKKKAEYDPKQPK